MDTIRNDITESIKADRYVPAIAIRPENTLSLHDLVVFHRKKSPNTVVDFETSAEVFRLETCQRFLCFAERSHLKTSPLLRPHSLDLITGTEAYSFLLRVVTGLESELIAETEILGQFKQAFTKQEGGISLFTRTLVQKLFEDAKDIRSQYLQNIGSVTYGSILRNFLKQLDSDIGSNQDRSVPVKTLLIGAGQMAKKLGPYLSGNIAIWNRTRSNAEALAASISSKDLTILDSQTEKLLEAISNADRIVFSIPAHLSGDDDFSRTIIKIILDSKQQPNVFHLGLRKSDSSPFNQVPGIITLDHFFEYRTQTSQARLDRAKFAVHGCLERAKLRSISLKHITSHGWEDLAFFS